MAIDIEGRMRRTWRYWYEDGLAEMATGCMLAAVGLLLFVQALLPAGTLNVILSVAGLPALVLAGSWLMGRLLTAAKERLTYPRTGYVAYRREHSPRRGIRGLAVGAVVGVLVGVLVAVLPSSCALIPALDGVLIGAGCLYLGHKLDLPRLYGLAVFSALAGALASLSGLGDLVGSAVYFGALGVALVASGVLALSTYLRGTQPLAEDHGQ
jgi:hypothetical protein